MRAKETTGRLLSALPRGLVRGALTVALVAGVPALALALWGGDLAKARRDAPPAAEALPFDAPATTLAQSRPQEGAGPASPAAGDGSVLVLDRWEEAAARPAKRKPSPFK